MKLRATIFVIYILILSGCATWDKDLYDVNTDHRVQENQAKLEAATVF